MSWIKLHRELLEWEWYSDHVVRSLFIHCILKANHKDNNWRGIAVKRGSFVSSYGKISDELGYSVQQIRTALKKLKSTNDLTYETNRQHTVFQVVRYDEYQSPTNEPTDVQQTNNKRSTTNKNDKNKKNDKNIIDYKSFVEFFNSTTNKNIRVTDTLKKLLKARLNDGYKKEDLLHVVQVKSSHWKGDEKMNQYLHPNTLFAKANFEKYIDEKKIEKSQNNDIILKQSDLNKNVW